MGQTKKLIKKEKNKNKIQVNSLNLRSV